MIFVSEYGPIKAYWLNWFYLSLFSSGQTKWEQLKCNADDLETKANIYSINMGHYVVTNEWFSLHLKWAISAGQTGMEAGLEMMVYMYSVYDAIKKYE